MGAASARRRAGEGGSPGQPPLLRAVGDSPLCDLLAYTLAVLRDPADADAAAHRGEANEILQRLWREPVTRPLVRRAIGVDQASRR